MNRRELLAGVASVGVLGGSAAVLWRGLSFGEGADSPSESATDSAENDSDGDTTDSSGPFELETLEAPGSEAETLTVPNDGLTLAMFFSPVCSRCQSLMPNMADAQTRLSDQYGDELTVVSVTGQQSPEQLREWWVDHDGDWTLAYDDGRVLTDRYDVVTHPVLMVIDSTGAVQWESEGVLEADRIVSSVERLLEDDSAADADEDAIPDGNDDAEETDSVPDENEDEHEH
ncbi:TlpA family protein disulfide reductase [Natronolimnobius baerhuensis]|uniref:Alkyl hydroperoxide reductase n=1 Tax=Natronolimnobius baerhuensis TaxID=253108 RepID=A0A202E975_9EURY|nr:redoxin domain-containing protein [Natronolimnobius baerhuensis]OVE84802.1 alkyl hydroperoxide reductase [Natronolimnobius baerhuensis]